MISGSNPYTKILSSHFLLLSFPKNQQHKINQNLFSKKKPTMHSSTTTTTDDSCSNNNLVILGLPVSSLQTSFLKSSTTTHFHKLVTQSSNHLMHNIHESFNKCISFLHLFASQNPLFLKLHSLSSEYHNFCQVNFRNQRKLKSVSNHDFAAIIPGDSMAGLVVSNGVLNFLNLYNTLLVVRLVLTWFPNTPPAIVTPLSTLCDPYLNIFRGVIPPLGGTLDLSPILAFLVLNALTSTASALPAELPSTESPEKGPSTQTNPSFHSAISHLTSTQKKWMKRFDTKTSNGSSIDD